ncbi:MAG: molybdopterin-dependent oxidoreductase [Nocardioides sp.]|uniref:molybdopterin-containing oxidoreductase family protein n=1 Tax=Nocardioides sp. TaxID=35761 RepID=UPI0032676414
MSERTVHQVYCRFCVAHCGLLIDVEDGEAVSVRGDVHHPISEGYTCAKGRSTVKAHYDPARLNHHTRRLPDGTVEKVSWGRMLEDIVSRVREATRAHGPDAVGLFIGTGGSHDAAGRRLAVKWLRGTGSRSQYSVATVDAPSKPLVAELVAGNPGLFSVGIDIERSKLTILVGSNPLVSHGHTSAWPNPRKHLRTLTTNGQLWVVDPRRTETAAVASRHLAPRVGTDHLWLAAIARDLLASADLDELKLRATGVDALAQALEPFSMERAAEGTGLALEDLNELLTAIRTNGRVAIQSGTGVSMSAAATVTEWLIWVIQIVTDSMDREGGSWFNPGFLRRADVNPIAPRDGQGDPGPPSRPELRARLGEFPAVALVDEIRSGNLKALFVFGANLVTSMPDTAATIEALGELDLLVALDVAENETTRLATHVVACAAPLERADLPFITDTYFSAVATQYAGPVVARAPGRIPSWRVFADLGAALGPDLLGGLDPDLATEADLLGPLTARSDVSLDELVEHPGAHISDAARIGWVRETALPGGRWRLAPAVLVEQLRSVEDPHHGLVLVPRRQLRQLNSQLVESGTADRRRAVPTIIMNPVDAAERGQAAGDRVSVSGSTGMLSGVLEIDPGAARGVVSIAHGHGNVNVNVLTSTVTGVDELTGMIMASGLPVEVGSAEP